MLRFLQSLNGSFIMKFVLIIIGLSFIGWEFGARFASNTSTSAVLTVNNQEMSQQDFQRALDGRLNHIQQQMGDAYSPELAARMNLTQRVFQAKITELLIKDFAQQQGLVVADEDLAQQISEVPAFQDSMGNFDTSQYKITIRNAGFSVNQFEQAMAGDILTKRARAPFENIEFTNQKEIKRLARLLSESRTVRILRVLRSDVPAPSEPTEQDLRTLYEDMQSTLKTPEQRTINMLVFDHKDVIERVGVTEKEIRNYYQKYRDTFGEPAGRVVQHILVEDTQTAQKAKQKLAQGVPFGDVAADFSQDSMTAQKNGNLGEVYPGDMLPAFDKAAFALEVGKVSEPVQTSFGVHLIKVTDIIPGDRKSLGEAKQEIRGILRKEKALNTIYDRVNEADDMLAAGNSIEQTAQNLGLDVIKVSVNANGQILEQSSKQSGEQSGEQKPATIPGDTQKVLDKAFTMDTGIPSTALDIGENTKAFISVTNVVPSRQKMFDEVQDELRNAYNKEMYERAVLAKATKLLTKRLQGDNFERLAKEHNLQAPIKTVTDINRREKANSPLISDSVQQKIVSMKAGEVIKEVMPTKLGAAIYEVTAVKKGQSEQKDLSQAQNILSQNLAGDLFQQFIAHLENKADIDINQKALTAVRERLIPTN